MSPGVVGGKWVCDETSTGPEKTLGLREYLDVVGQQQDCLAGRDFGKAPVPPPAGGSSRGWSNARMVTMPPPLSRKVVT